MGRPGFEFAAMPDRLKAFSHPLFRPAQLRTMKGTQQVAAICYRLRKTRIEFLLVHSRGGHWTFPKGAIESGLSHAQAAALEAFEEAGVHGRIEEASFARYTHRKGGGKNGSRKDLFVQAHLCRVMRLCAPKESNRRPTWFVAEKAKRRLQQRRAPDCATQLVRVLDLAVARIRETEYGADNLAWRQVCFEAFQARLADAADPGLSGSAWRALWQSAAGAVEPSGPRDPRKLLRIPQLTSGSDVGEGATQVVNITNASRAGRRRSDRWLAEKRKNSVR